jgi:RNA polymerase sigma factor (sigma-70 family)
MRGGGLRQALEHLRLADGGLTDGQLLGRFVAGRDEAAFAALVRRHGPMVLGACRRVLGHAQDAEDAFQATFLLLACKAPSVARREALAGWLHAVAYRTALKAKARAGRRRARERQVEQVPHPEVAPAEPQDWRPLLDRELAALPEKYRAAVALCDLEGRPRREAARLLGLSEGTLSSRLARARCLLARRLGRRGLALSGGALAACLAAGAATAAVPACLVVRTAKSAALAAAGRAVVGDTAAAILVHEVQRGLLMTKLKVCAATAAVAVLLGAGGFAYRAAGQAPRPEKSAEVRPPADGGPLRKEVEILKLQVELLQEKVRAQGEEIRALKGRTGGPDRPRGLTSSNPFGNPPAENVAPASNGAQRGQPPADPAPGGAAPVGLAPAAPAPKPAGGAQQGRPAPFGGDVAPVKAWGAGGASLTPEDEAEAALKALRQARDPETRRRAAEALERAVKKLRARPAKEAPSGEPSPRR